MHENLDKFIAILEKVVSGNGELNAIESELLNISNNLKINLSAVNKDDLDLKKKIKFWKINFKNWKKFKKSSTLLEEFKKFIEQKKKSLKN